ncbi:MerR family DNA-binding transcriptional regulator [Actinoallomurus sp. NPDC052274]
MDGTHAAVSLLTIGDLARRTGLPVRTIQYWSETGVVPEATAPRGRPPTL